jgi:hypothetical protein
MKFTKNLLPYQRRIIIAASVTLLLSCLLIATPYFIQHKLTGLLLEMGAQQASIVDVNFNPFSGVLEIYELRFSTATATNQQLSKLSVNVHLLSLFKKWIHLKSFTMEGLNLSIEIDASGKPVIGGLQIPATPESDHKSNKESKPWGFGIDAITLSRINVDYRDPKLESNLNIEALHIGELANWNGELASPISLKAKLNEQVLLFEGKVLPFAKDPTFTGKAVLKQIELKPFAPLLPQLQHLSGQLSLDSTIELVQHSDSAIEIVHTGLFTLENLLAQNPEVIFKQQQLNWNGTFSLTTKEEQLQVSMDALLTLKGVAVASGESDLASIDNLSTTIRFDSLDLLTLSENAINQLVIGNKLYLAESADESAQRLLSIGTIAIPVITLAKMQQLDIDTISITNLHSLVRRDPQGVWAPATLLAALPQQPAAETETPAVQETAASSNPLSYRIGKITMQGENHILFDDRGVTPPYHAALLIKSMELGQIDSTQTDTATPLNLLAAVDQHSEISVTGTITPLALKPTLDLTNSIKAVPLSPLSSYVVPMMGYQLTSGQLDAENSIKMAKGKIDGEINLTLNALEVEAVTTEAPKVTTTENGPAESKDTDESKAQLSIPLGTALNMLRDKNRTIKLTIPISGDSDNPDIDPSDVINTAIAKAMKKGAMSYLIAALQPYGTLISLAQIAGEAAMKVRLEPIKFASASAAVTSETREYLQKVITLMADRPEINIKVCGVAVAADHQTMLAEATTTAEQEALKKKLPKPVPSTISDDQLLQLARARVAAVKEILISEFKADATHLIDCQPIIIREAAENPPRVELLI